MECLDRDGVTMRRPSDELRRRGVAKDRERVPRALARHEDFGARTSKRDGLDGHATSLVVTRS